MIVVIVGPTGVGKSKLAVELAKRINAEVINGDSMQVYKDLDIATAKIKKEEMDNIPHHLLDIADKNELYTVFDYQRDCRRVIADISSRGKNIIIVGGTGLYIKAALYDYSFKKEENAYDFSNMSNEELMEEILKSNSDTNVHINNRKRLERELTKIYNNSTNTKMGNIPLYDFKVIGLTVPREELYSRINSRVEEMVRSGLIEEAHNLYVQGINSKAINTGIGYKELYKYFDGVISLDGAIELIKKNSRHYAKRQYTFFLHQFQTKWIDVDYSNFNNTVLESFNYITKEK